LPAELIRFRRFVAAFFTGFLHKVYLVSIFDPGNLIQE
jgi:hypothetical protein